MQRVICLALALTYCAVASAQTTGLDSPAWGHIAAVRALKAGTRIEVESLGTTGFADLDERCRLLKVDASTLTCTAEDDAHTCLVFPLAEVEAVYRVRHTGPSLGAILAVAVAGIFIGGLAAAWAPGIAVGILGGIVALAINDNRRQRLWWGIPPPPPQPPERLVLVYHR